MRLTLPPFPRMIRRELIGRRTIGIVLVVIVHILGLLLLLSLAPEQARRLIPEIKSFPLLSLSERKAPPRPVRQATTVRRDAPLVPPPIVPPLPQAPLNMIVVSSEVFKASDISKIRSQSIGTGAATGPSGSEQAEGNGDGPGGERLYPADWYREPTHAEMAYYLPKNQRAAGWGMIACRTAANFRVEDCQELGESPSGSGLARAVRQAAWQFRVRPPTRGDRPMIGVWVRIVFDFQVGVVK